MTPKEILESVKQKAAPVADASHIGAKSLSLPLIVNAKDFRISKINRPKEIIQGVLTQGARMVLAGPSKSRKKLGTSRSMLLGRERITLARNRNLPSESSVREF